MPYKPPEEKEITFKSFLVEAIDMDGNRYYQEGTLLGGGEWGGYSREYLLRRMKDAIDTMLGEE